MTTKRDREVDRLVLAIVDDIGAIAKPGTGDRMADLLRRVVELRVYALGDRPLSIAIESERAKGGEGG